ncbi:MAG TPA: CBS domain-containing protein [bacterium]|nr:CBS domain-containing protein [bacterium]
MTKVRELMRREVITVLEDTPLQEAVALLIQHRISGLPVVNRAGELVGLITEKDVMRLLHEEPGACTTVRDLMTTKVRAFQADDDLELVTDCLLANHFRRVPILEGRKLVGLISRADLMPTVLALAQERLGGS